MKNNKLWIFLKGLIIENPVLVLVLGTCPTLAVTTSALNGIGMGLSATFVLICLLLCLMHSSVLLHQPMYVSLTYPKSTVRCWNSEGRCLWLTLGVHSAS